MAENRVPITVAKGDGIGPEIMDAVMNILEKAGARIAPEYIDIGEQVYLSGNSSGIDEKAWESIMRTKVFLKAPITTPQGGGYKSLNVTTRKTLGLFANVRPCRTYTPYVPSKHDNTDLVIVRENEEDTYGGIEHQQTDEVVQCLKLISRPGCEKIVRFAFEYAKNNGRKKVTCFTKDNIMKMTDGLFHKVFDEIGQEYPEIEQEHWIIDIGSAKMAASPDAFDVIVTPNLYGDVISDIAAQISGSVGIAGGANIGINYAMFEAIHGSAPRRAGQNKANPSGLLHGALMMLDHIGQPDVAEKVHNAWLATLENGRVTYDLYREGQSREKLGTKEFGEAIAEHLGEKPKHLQPVQYFEKPSRKSNQELYGYSRPAPKKKELFGVDVFLHWAGTDPDQLAEQLNQAATNELELTMITNRGTKVYPGYNPETFCTDHWRCRFKSKSGNPIANPAVIQLLQSIYDKGLDFIKTEQLYEINGEPAFSKGQGE